MPDESTTGPITIRRLFRNYLSLLGAVITGISFTVNVFLLLVEYLAPRQNPYLGIITYMILPGVTLTGLAMVCGGALHRYFRLRRGKRVVELPHLDLNIPRHRYVVFGGIFLIVGFLGLSAVGGYESYHYTDSVTFCGQTCHEVMRPEFTAYQHSPHARVACVDCHIGSGAEWFVKAKISGAYQVYSVTFNKYSRPIETPVRNLRPAQDTCEQCHWPAKFWGEQLASRVHFASDKANTRREIDLLIKTGGGSGSGLAEGIHYHMNITNKIWYIATDEKRLEIPWVRLEDNSGKVTEFVSSEKPMTPEQRRKGEMRRMDCMDCHNRPSHRYLPPGRALDPSLEGGRISADLPFIKKVAVEAMVQPYTVTPEALQKIEQYIRDFYQKEYPSVVKDQGEKLTAAIAEVKRVYGINFFPEMRVNWQAYPEHIGHKEFPGCFRCHDGKHVAQDGKVISRECASCHEFLLREKGGLARVPTTPSFAHPWKLGGKHAEILCGACHTGGPAKPAICSGCHNLPTADVPMASMTCRECHLKEQVVQPIVGCAKCHPGMGGLHKKAAHKDAGCASCHLPHRWSPEPRETCLTCHGDKKEHNPGPACAECHDFKAAAGAPKTAAGKPAAITFPADASSPGAVTFDHAKHLAKGATCADCHPKYFKMQKGGAKFTMDDMGKGMTCGACHNGKKAFGVEDGDKCMSCHKEA
jgi:c(7)-type cytochrome triheme protein